MSINSNQKLKLLYLLKIFLEETDDMHGLTSKEIIERLGDYDISVERKTLYSDIELLNYYGFDIIKEHQNRKVIYRIASRMFELPELKVMVDLIQSSKFITHTKSKELIKKLEGLLSTYEAKELNRQVYVSDVVKSSNESIYYNVDTIYNALNMNRSLDFLYFQWDTDKKKKYKHNGMIYNVSPWALLWENENYYLVGYDEVDKIIKHFRVDKIRSASLSSRKRIGKEVFKDYNISYYTKTFFQMYGGVVTKVTLHVDDSFVGIFIDRFGKDIPIKKRKGYFETEVQVALSPHFYSWILALGNKVKIVAPELAVEGIKQLITTGEKIYGK